MAIYFYSSLEEPYGCFSNFSRHGVEIDNVYYKTCEHYFQAMKFDGSTKDMEDVRRAATPKLAAQIGRDRSRPLRHDWETVKDDVMRRGVLHKFRRHADIQAILLGTGSAELIENSPVDYYWGSGADGTGLNKLGYILMEVRSLLQREVQDVDDI
ncbi:MAG TPA: NADAR family protein [Aggregatilineales bacterium]|nr:NADAR family protein [Aggregatilineales bacterium]